MKKERFLPFWLWFPYTLLSVAVEYWGEKIMAKAGNKGKGADSFYCQCGGPVKMVSVWNRGKLRPEARCSKCGKVARYPGALRE